MAAIDGREPKYNMIHPYKRPSDGNIIWVHVMGHVVRDEQGNPTNVYGVVMDITERRQAEQYEQFRSRILELLAGNNTLSDALEAIVIQQFSL